MVTTADQAYQSTKENENKDTTQFSAVVKTQKEAQGSSGTQVYGGYFSEEYLTDLRGTRGAKVYDEMRRSEPQIAMLMNAIKNPIKSAEWGIEPFDNSEAAKLQADFIKVCLKEQIDWDNTLHEILTFMEFGHSVMEVVHNVIFNHPRFGTCNGLGTLGFRSQKTIERWNLEKKTGKLLSVAQYVYSDIGSNTCIDGDFLLVFSLSKEGDNYEGISALRPMYGPWMRKNLYLKLMAIGFEKYMVGTPIGTIPKGKTTAEEEAAFKQVLESYTSHELAYITVPEGWTIDIKNGEFDGTKIKDIITMENTEMVNSLVANFLALGLNGSGGSFSLGSDLSDFFLSGIQSYANLACGTINRKLIPNLVRLNFGPQPGYPMLKCTGINDKAGKELAEIIKSLTDSQTIKPDMPLEEFLRTTYKLPKADPSTSREVKAAIYPDPQAQAKQFSEGRIILDEKYRKQFNKSKESVKQVMQENLRSMYSGVKDALRKKYKTDGIKAAINLSTPGVNAYKAALRPVLAEIAANALKDARRKVPSKKNIKLCEQVDSIKLADGYYDALPKFVRDLITAQTNLIVDSQVSDLEKVTFFQFTSSATSTDNIDQILADVDDSVEPILDSGVGAGMNVDVAASNAVAHTANQAQLDFFFEPEVMDEIESFTFENEDPVSEICQALAGTTWAANDPDVSRYSPPLHHNCKSRLTPNLKGVDDNPDIQRGGTALTQKALDSITLSECKHSTPAELYRVFNVKK